MGFWAWAGELLIHLGDDAKANFGDTISITKLADLVVSVWRAEL